MNDGNEKRKSVNMKSMNKKSMNKKRVNKNSGNKENVVFIEQLKRKSQIINP